MKSRHLIWILPLLVLAGAVSACAGQSGTGNVALAPMSEMPDFVKDAPPQVQEAYQFAVANPEILQQMPVVGQWVIRITINVTSKRFAPMGPLRLRITPLAEASASTSRVT